MIVDITHEPLPDTDDDDDEQFVVEGCDGAETYLRIGSVKILLTPEQIELIRYYFENT